MARTFPAQLVLFLVLFAWHVQVTVDPRCVAFVQSELFLWNLRFFRDFLLAPGDLAEWLGRAVLQACHFGWPGALILTGIAWLILFSTMEFFKRLSPSTGGAAWMAPALVLIAVHSRYDYSISATLGVAMAMVATLGYAALGARWGHWRLLGLSGLGALVYYTAGAAFYVFSLCVLIHEFQRPCRWWTKIGCVLGAIAGRFLVDAVVGSLRPSWFFLHVPATAAFAAERSLSALAGALYAAFPLSAALVADRAARRRDGKHPERRPDDVQPRPDRPEASGARLRWMAASVLFAAGAAFAGWAAARPQERIVLALHASADREQWEEVLRLASRVVPDRYSQYVVHDVNMALYHVGRMPYDMFAYRQFASPVVVATHPGPNVLPFLDLDALALRKLGDFHFHLGRLNDAEYHVHESFVRRPCAECLRQLARIALAKDQVDQARLFLNVLRDDLMHKAWAEDALNQLHGAGNIPLDPEIDSVRLLRLVDEDVHLTAKFVANPIIAGRTVSTRKQIASALRQNPRNRMAFEFLMAWYLVDANVTEVVGWLPMTANYSYPATPPLYEEAAMIQARVYEKRESSAGSMVVNGCAISEDTLRKVRKLDEALDSRAADAKEIARIAKQVGLSYFHFYYDGRWGD